tara:strand:- start:1641 stop:2348 length:708 start_codon:yes stop_codon:yes gene_type:complete
MNNLKMAGKNKIKGSRSQSGFTLIEIAIVLVIIGLLLGGVLQGQQLIENSRVRSATNTLNGIAAAAFSYQDRYGRMPGDDGPALANLTARGGAWGSIPATAFGNSDGILTATAANTFTGAAAEGAYFFTHLRAAGFITGDATTAAGSAAILPSNPFGGVVGITGATIFTNMNGNKLCMSNVPGSAGIALDTQLDDGAANTGRFRGQVDTTGADAPTGTVATAYDENNNYVVCYRM